MAKSSCLSTKRNLSILLIFLFPSVFYRRIFNLKMQNFRLENHHMIKARQPFCWQMTSTKLSNPPLSQSLCGWPFDFCGGSGYGWFSLGKNFFPKPLGLEIFSLTYNGVRTFFSVIYVISNIFFSVQDIVFPRCILASFSPSRSVSRILSSEITHNLLKSQIIGR